MKITKPKDHGDLSGFFMRIYFLYQLVFNIIGLKATIFLSLVIPHGYNPSL